ncbi:hypothetical protein FRC07_015110 [Ceratobasidium sp. 392]|nr:hypothetical protein FRC07_015110 [Ceratobasidium sp. 392]
MAAVQTTVPLHARGPPTQMRVTNADNVNQVAEPFKPDTFAPPPYEVATNSPTCSTAPAPPMPAVTDASPTSAVPPVSSVPAPSTASAASAASTTSAAPRSPQLTEQQVSQALTKAVESGQDQTEIERLVDQVIDLAGDERRARKLVEAGAIPTLITQFHNLSPNGKGIDRVILALGLLSHDLLSANSIVRTKTAALLMEISKAMRDESVRAYSAWCLGRLIRSDDIATKFIDDNLHELLLGWVGTSQDKTALRCCVWALGTLARTDALAGKLVESRAIPILTEHLQRTAIPGANPEDLGIALFGVARLSRTISFAKALAAAGSVEPMVRSLRDSHDTNVLNWSARAIGCHVRPNSSDVAKMLLEEGVAKGLAQLPSRIPAPHGTDALGSFAFAVERFSCAEWGSGPRKMLVQAGVVDSLLTALRAATDVPDTDPQVHAELAFAISFLGDVGGSAIRKEIRDAGGIDILEQVAKEGPPDVQKASATAIKTVTGNMLTRTTASTKATLSHDWNGGCPEYLLGRPDLKVGAES